MTATDIDLDALIDALAARAAARARPLVNAAGDEITALAAAGLVTVNPGDLITSQWGNLTYGQTNLAFASVADRNSQWTTPPEGAQCVTLDTGSPWIYRAGAWHGRPAGLVSSISGPITVVSCGSTATTVLSLAGVPLVAGRRYRVTCNILGQQVTAQSGQTYSVINDTAGGIPSGMRVFTENPLNLNAYTTHSWGWVFTAASTVADTITMTALTTAGSFTVLANDSQIAVEDIGG